MACTRLTVQTTCSLYAEKQALKTHTTTTQPMAADGVRACTRKRQKTINQPIKHAAREESCSFGPIVPLLHRIPSRSKGNPRLLLSTGGYHKQSITL